MSFQPAGWETRSVNFLARFELVWQLSFGNLAGKRKTEKAKTPMPVRVLVD